jgi:uncharacterized protein (TIGR02145 family)
MKKMIFLMLTLLIWSAASMNAQVTIGKDTVPHAGAVLDLRATNQGLKLPTVSLDPDLTQFVLTENGTSTPEKAIGMLVYNTNPAVGAGLYVWNGSNWLRDGSVHGTAGAGLVGDSAKYRTWVYPGLIGEWMLDNSREGLPNFTEYPGKKTGERGHYYNAERASSACPSGWRLPTVDELRKLGDYLHNNASPREYAQWFEPEKLAGYRYGAVYCDWWGEQGCYRANEPTRSFYANMYDTSWSGIVESPTFVSSYLSVRCIKE